MQGDPLSPFLFITVAKALSKFVEKASNRGLKGGFQVSDEWQSVRLLQFGDNSLFFYDVTKE